MGSGRTLTAFGLLTLSAVLLALGACAGLPQVGASTEAASTGISGSTLTGTTPERSQFNPFADPTATSVGGREVIANPTIADIMQPGPLPERTLGRLDAPVTIVEYASMTCPYCRKFDAEVFPVLKREYIDTGKVFYILREFPIGHQSGAATIALRCAPADKHFVLFSKLMAQQPAWVSQEVRLDPIFKVAQQVGMTRAEFDACQQDKALSAGLAAVKDRGRKLGVIGTPNFFVNGKLVKTVVGINEIRAMVDPIVAAKVAGR